MAAAETFAASRRDERLPRRRRGRCYCPWRKNTNLLNALAALGLGWLGARIFRAALSEAALSESARPQKCQRKSPKEQSPEALESARPFFRDRAP